jgi:hypothetical protein
MKNELDIVLDNGKVVKAYFTSAYFSDHRVITTCALHFSPEVFGHKGTSWFSGVAIKHPSDEWTENGRALAYRRAWEKVNECCCVRQTKEWWQKIRKARFEAEKKLEQEEAWQLMLDKYPYHAEEKDPRNQGGPVYRNVRILLDGVEETTGWLSLSGWCVNHPMCILESHGSCGQVKEYEVSPSRIQWGEIDDYTKLAEEISRRNGNGSK